MAELTFTATPVAEVTSGNMASAFESHPAARATWESLSFSHQREYPTWIEGAKKAETRQSRVAKAVERLDAGATSSR